MRKLLYLLILCVFFCSCSSTPKAENPIEEGLSPQAEVTGSVQSSDVASESLAEVPESDTEVVGETSELPGISDSAEVFENTASAEESIVEDTTVSSSSKTLYKPLQLNRLPIDEKNRRRAIEETLSEEVLANLPFNDSVNSGSAVGGAESDVSEEKSVTDAANTTDTVSTVSPVENNDSPETEANEPAIENADSISITDETDAEVPQPSDTVISIPEENADIQPTGVTEEDTAEQRTEDIAVEKQTEAVTKEADAKKGNSIAEIPTSQPESTVILPEKEEKSTQADDDTGTVTPLIVETTSAPDSTDSEKVADTGTSQENPQELSQNKTQTNQADEPLMSEVIDYEAIERDLQEETSDEKQYESDNIEYVKRSNNVKNLGAYLRKAIEEDYYSMKNINEIPSNYIQDMPPKNNENIEKELANLGFGPITANMLIESVKQNGRFGITEKNMCKQAGIEPESLFEAIKSNDFSTLLMLEEESNIEEIPVVKETENVMTNETHDTEEIFLNTILSGENVTTNFVKKAAKQGINLGDLASTLGMSIKECIKIEHS